MEILITIPDLDDSGKAKDQSITDFLKESTTKVGIEKIDEKHTYKEDSVLLRKVYGWLKAQFFRGVAGDATAVAQSLFDLVKGKHDTIQKLNTTEQELRKQLEAIELQFLDTNHPYGKLGLKPNIKIIRKPSDLTAPPISSTGNSTNTTTGG